jgi:hypothetical protein
VGASFSVASIYRNRILPPCSPKNLPAYLEELPVGHFTSITLTIFLFCAFQESNNNGVQDVIKKLGSANFKEREAAKKWLLARPGEVKDALQKATRSSDLEIARQAALILRQIDNLPFREIQIAVEERRIERAISLLAKFPESKNESGVWSAARDLALLLMRLHQKKGGEPVRLGFLEQSRDGPVIQTGNRVTIPPLVDRRSAIFLRANEILVDKNSVPESCFIITSGNLAVRHLWCSVVVSRGTVKVERITTRAIIVSSGDVAVDDLVNSLVIAKGKVTCSGAIKNSRIISASSVTCRAPENCIITENESAPLGLTHFFEKPPGNEKRK